MQVKVNKMPAPSDLPQRLMGCTRYGLRAELGPAPSIRDWSSEEEDRMKQEWGRGLWPMFFLCLAQTTWVSPACP